MRTLREKGASSNDQNFIKVLVSIAAREKDMMISTVQLKINYDLRYITNSLGIITE